MNTAPVALGDLFSSGITNFKTAFERFKGHLMSVLLLAIPVAVANVVGILILVGCGLVGAGAAATAGSDEAQAATQAVMMLGSLAVGFLTVLIVVGPVMIYSAFCNARFVAKANQSPELKWSLGSLFSYESSIWGFIGVGLIQFGIGIGFSVVAMVVMLMTFFVLGLPAYFVGQLAVATLMPMSCVYLKFVLWGCYRDSCSATGAQISSFQIVAWMDRSEFRVVF